MKPTPKLRVKALSQKTLDEASGAGRTVCYGTIYCESCWTVTAGGSSCSCGATFDCQISSADWEAEIAAIWANYNFGYYGYW